MLAVCPERWGHGLGGVVLEAVQRVAVERGFTRTQLWSHEVNRRAHALYERLGWRTSGCTEIDEHGQFTRRYVRDL